MKGFARRVLALACATALAVSCNKDDASGSLSFAAPAVFVAAGERATVSYAASGVAASSLGVSGTPDGWEEPVLDVAARTITIKAPLGDTDADGKKVAESGTITLTGRAGERTAVTAKLFVARAATVAHADRSNCYLVSQPGTHHTFDALHRPDGVQLATASVEIVWQSRTGLIEYLALEDGRVSFYVPEGTDDPLKEGNALIGAYDKRGDLLWSWHVWVADYDPEAPEGVVSVDGVTMMRRNLGALGSANGTSEDILASYGLYYQWGRKEPFIGPNTYQASQGASAAMYNGKSRRVYLTTEASDAKTGTQEYAVRHPLTFLTAEKDADWCAESGAVRWAQTKTVYDPCPAGWRVADPSAFAGWTIAEPLDGADAADRYADKFGWQLERNGVQALFIGAGYRLYLDGKINNIYDNLPVRNAAMDMQPWTGYYWTTEAASAGVASAFYFWFNKSDVPGSGVHNGEAMGRANGMPVRCVKE